MADEQISESREAFFLIDKGMITLEELAYLVQSLNTHLSGLEIGSEVDLEEFLNIMSTKMEAVKMKENVEEEEVKEAFKVFDRDQDGFISAGELRNVMLSMGERLSDEEAEQMIREADLDGDGLVSYDDFVRMTMMA